MTSTVAVRCSNEDCWKWFEPEAPDETRPTDDTPAFRRAATAEAVCPHCGTRQAVPIMDNWGRTSD